MSGSIVMSVKEAHKYDPRDRPELPEELAIVRNPALAVHFAKQYGLLQTGPFYPDDEYVDGIARDQIPAEVQEPYTLFERHAQKIREILEVVEVLRRTPSRARAGWLREWARSALRPSDEELARSNNTDDPENIARLRKLTDPSRWIDDDREVVNRSGLWVAATLDAEVARLSFSVNQEPDVFAPVPGKFRLDVWSDTLLGYCYLQLVEQLTGGAELARCRNPVCDRVFARHHGRQQYCTDRCASAARMAIFRRTGKGIVDKAIRSADTRSRKGGRRAV